MRVRLGAALVNASAAAERMSEYLKNFSRLDSCRGAWAYPRRKMLQISEKHADCEWGAQRTTKWTRRSRAYAAVLLRRSMSVSTTQDACFS